MTLFGGVSSNIFNGGAGLGSAMGSMAFPAGLIGGGYTLANFINGLYNAAALKRVNSNLSDFQKTGDEFYPKPIPTNRNETIDYMSWLKDKIGSTVLNQNNLDAYGNFGGLVQGDEYTNKLVGDMRNAVNDARYQTGQGVRNMTNLGDLSKYSLNELQDKYSSLNKNMPSDADIRQKLYDATNYKYYKTKGLLPAETEFIPWLTQTYGKVDSPMTNSPYSIMDYVNTMNQRGELDKYIKNYKAPLQGSATTNSTGTEQPPTIPPLIPGGVEKNVPKQPTNWDGILDTLMKNTNTVNNNTTNKQDNAYPLIPFSMVKMPILQSLFR
jgi:hypothetical protein